MIAMQADIRIMSEHARIGIAEVRWNMPGAGWMIPLTRQIGLGNALELTLWGDTQYTAQRAYEAGWVQRVVPADQLMDTAMEYATRMLDMAPRAVRNNKQAMYRGFYMDPLQGAAYGNALEQNLVGMQDSVEGPTAFAEKRRPNFIDA
jgi:enoyl-CoA hydratase/carnithine racemase